MNCLVNADDTLLNVYYNGVDITSSVTPSFGLTHLAVQKSFSFAYVPGAYLVLYGGNIQNVGTKTSCDDAGFAIQSLSWIACSLALVSPG